MLSLIFLVPSNWRLIFLEAKLLAPKHPHSQTVAHKRPGAKAILKHRRMRL